MRKSLNESRDRQCHHLPVNCLFYFFVVCSFVIGVYKMTSVEFCYWLQGCFEINPPNSGFTAEQTEIIKRHLHLVFKHEIDASYPDQDALNAIHNTFMDGKDKPGQNIRC
jgi:hypothetical protein